jgi:alpha-beta hydrolase superfamily lysophospholipase
VNRLGLLFHVFRLSAILAACLAALAATTSPAWQSPPAIKPSPLTPQPSWTAPADAPFLDFSTAWPARVEVGGKKGIIREIPGDTHGWTQRWGFTGPVTHDAEDFADREAWRAAFGPEAPIPAFEGKGAYLVHFENHPNTTFSQRPKPSDRPVLRFKYISAERDPTKPQAPPTLQRTSFVFYEPFADAEPMTGVLAHEKARGVALVMPGLFGTPDTVIDVMVRRLRQDRWYVLRLLSASSRFTETVTYTFDTKGEVGGTLEESARVMALPLQSRAAEIAYAVEAAFAHLHRVRPQLTGLPRIVMGSSAGAITLPTVVAREPQAYRAAVFVGGGADFWLINARSNYARGVDAIRSKWIRGEPTEADLRIVDAAYLAAAPLDAYHTAKVLHEMPVLMVHGAVDRAVPAALGNLLWERLARPERIVMQVGHEMLFASVAGRLTEISEWLAAAIEGKKGRTLPTESVK